MLAATSCLCQYPELFNKVVPSTDNHSFNPADGYCGIFRFKFWTFGKWTEVVVDDRLPTYNGNLVFLHSAQKNEYWSSLFEKAYAKSVIELSKSASIPLNLLLLAFRTVFHYSRLIWV